MNADLIALASEVGIAVFTAIVAILEVTRFFQGPNISFVVPDEMTLHVESRLRTATPIQEYATFQFPIVISNVGPRGGALAEVEVRMINPIWQIGPTKELPSFDRIILTWWWMDSHGQEHVFSKNSLSALSIRDNESVGLMAKLDLHLSNGMDTSKPPNYSLRQIEKQFPQFEFSIDYKTTRGRKRSLVSGTKTFKIKPRFYPEGHFSHST